MPYATNYRYIVQLCRNKDIFPLIIEYIKVLKFFYGFIFKKPHIPTVEILHLALFKRLFEHWFEKCIL